MSAVVSIHISATERVVAKLREQATAQTEIAAALLLKPSKEAATYAIEHQETARLFKLLHDACVSGGLLDRLQDEALQGARA